MKNNETTPRLRKFLAALSDLGFHAVLLDNRDDIFYFTGYTGSDAVAIFSVKSGKGWLITDSRYLEEAEKTSANTETVIWKSGFPAYAGKLLKKIRAIKIGYTPGTLTASFWQGMRDQLGDKPEWVDVWNEITALRSVKTPREITFMEAALDCAQRAFLTAKKRWRVGMTERELKNDLEWEMRRLGAQDASFETIVAVGANASLPHAHSGERKLVSGKMVLIDFGARVNRYCSDLTRTLWPGSIPGVWKKRYRSVLAAQLAGMEAIRAGVRADIPYRKAVAELDTIGIGDRFTHSLGHGIGLAVHEFPRLAPHNRKPLVAGNIVTVEPGVYFPGGGGIRTEDMVLVEEGGVRVLSSLPKGLEDAIF